MIPVFCSGLLVKVCLSHGTLDHDPHYSTIGARSHTSDAYDVEIVDYH